MNGCGAVWARSAAPEAHAGGVGRRPGPEGRAERPPEAEIFWKFWKRGGLKDFLCGVVMLDEMMDEVIMMGELMVGEVVVVEVMMGEVMMG